MLPTFDWGHRHPLMGWGGTPAPPRRTPQVLDGPLRLPRLGLLAYLNDSSGFGTTQVAFLLDAKMNPGRGMCEYTAGQDPGQRVAGGGEQGARHGLSATGTK